jgi:protein-tyrosine-phosphatase
MLLFVCESNSAMSPMAEAICRDVYPSLIAQSAGLYPSHVRQPLKEVLREKNINEFGLCSKDLFGVDLSEVHFVIGLGMPDPLWRLPSRLSIEWWGIPDPTCFPREEQMDGYRALRDELYRRIPQFVEKIGLFS